MSLRLPFAVALFFAGCAGAATSNDSSSEYVGNVEPPAGSIGGAVTGLPCDVAEILAKSCTSCHSNPPVSGAPYALSDYEDLRRPSPADPGQTVAQRSVARMKDTKSPMPPGGGVGAAEIAALQNWIDGGMPRGDCASTSGGAPNPWSAPEGCLGSNWTGGDRESPLMHPGRACIDCHKSDYGAPQYAFAGTVYSSAHETDDCNAVTSDVSATRVILTGADGRILDLSVNSVGNFYSRTALALPYKAELRRGGKVRAMATPQTNGDCNACHSVKGDSEAKGRVLVP